MDANWKKYATICEDGFTHAIYARSVDEAYEFIKDRGMNERFEGEYPKSWKGMEHLDERDLSDEDLYQNLNRLLHQTVYATRIAFSSRCLTPEYLLKETGPLHELIHMLNKCYDPSSDHSDIRNKLTDLFDSIPGFRIPKEDNLI